MTEKDIEAIVEEVIRRIHSISKRNRVLVLMSPLGDVEAVDRYLKEIGVEPYATDKFLIDCNDNATALQNYNIQNLMDEHSSLFLSGLTVKQLLKIQEIQMNDPVTELTVEALRLGKPVTVMSKWVDTSNGAPAFNRKLDDLKQTLTTWGITFATETDHSYRNRNDQRVIAKQDLKNVLHGELEIREDAVVTTTAKELLHKRNIKIVRCQRT